MSWRTLDPCPTCKHADRVCVCDGCGAEAAVHLFSLNERWDPESETIQHHACSLACLHSVATEAAVFEGGAEEPEVRYHHDLSANNRPAIRALLFPEAKP